MMTWSDDAAFWAFNQVTNYAYTRYNLIHPEVEKKQAAYEKAFVEELNTIDKKAKELLSKDKNEALKYLTDYSSKAADNLTSEWQDFYKYLFMKYMDGNVKTKAVVPEGYKYHTPDMTQPGYSEEWKKRVAKETGDKLKMPTAPAH